MGADDARADAAASLLLEARRAGPIEKLPDSCRPRSEAEAYAIQDAVAARLGPIEGWKVGAGSPDQTPNCAPLLAGSLMTSPAWLDPARYVLRGVEAEIAFRFARDLPPRERDYTRDDVMAAIETAFPAIEVCECRFRDWSSLDPLSKLADNNMNQALVIGPAWDDWRGLTIDDRAVRLLLDDAVAVERMGGNTAGDIFRLLVWLANRLRQRGQGLRRGDVVTTGSWCGLIQAGAATRVVIGFPGIGGASLSFRPEARPG